MRWLVLLVTLIWSGAAIAGSPDVWRLGLRAQVDGVPRVLADVADVQRTSPALLEQYGAISLTGLAGVRRIGAAQLLPLLDRAGVDFSRIELHGAEFIEVNTAAPHRVVQLAEQAVLRRVMQLRNVQADDVRVRVVDLPQDVATATNVADVEVGGDFAQLEAGSVVPVTLRLLGRAGEVVRDVAATASVALRSTVVVASRELHAGERLTRGQVHLEKLFVPEGVTPLGTLQEIDKHSWIVRSDVAAGDVVSTAAVQAIIPMQRGAMVALVSRDSNLRIRALGRVKSVADDGVTVLVENIDSKKELMGRPLSASEVEVVF